MSEHLRVYGHPRSGNHYLAAMLHRHFYDDDADMALEVDPHGTGHWSRRQSRRRAPDASFTYGDDTTEGDVGTTLVPYGKLLGHHRLPPRFDSPALYIYRDGRDVALSMHAWSRFRPSALEELTLEQYISRPIDWQGSPGYRATPKETIFAHWMRHVSTWLRVPVLAIRYEDVVRAPARWIARIGEHFELPLRRPVETIGPVGWNASTAAAGDVEKRLAKWRTGMSMRAQAVYDAQVPRDFVGRWDP